MGLHTLKPEAPVRLGVRLDGELGCSGSCSLGMLVPLIAGAASSGSSTRIPFGLSMECWVCGGDASDGRGVV